MNSEELKILGKIVKQKYPQYANLSDEEVGRLVAKKYPQYAKELSLPQIPSLTGAETKVLVKENEHFAAYGSYLASRDVIVTQAQTARHKAETDKNAHEQANKTHEVTIHTLEATIVQSDAQKVLTEQALDNGMDIPTHNQFRLSVENQKLEISKAQELSKLKLDEYQKEVNIDLNAILAQKLIAHETVLGIKARLQSLIQEREDIGNLKVSGDTKQRLLDQQDKVIAVFQENLRVQMERHLLQDGAKEDLGGNQPPPDGKTND